MNKNHLEILLLIYEYLSQPGADHLRFGQALINLNVIEENEQNRDLLAKFYNMPDQVLLKRMKK